MAAMQESSVMFSLNQILNAHETRVREEQEAAVRRAEAERKAREETARLEAEAVAAKLRAEAEKKAMEEAARRAEELRLEAMRVQAIEKARLEAQVQARVEMMRKAEEHEKALAALKADRQKKRLRRAVVSSVLGAVAVLGAAMGIYFGKIEPETQARLSEQSGRIAQISEDREDLQARLNQTSRKIQDAEQALKEEQAKRDAELEAAKAAAAESEPATPARPVAQRPNGAPRQPVAPTTPVSECLPGDPSCDVNGRRIF